MLTTKSVLGFLPCTMSLVRDGWPTISTLKVPHELWTMHVCVAFAFPRLLSQRPSEELIIPTPTLDDDYAAYVLARELGKPENITKFLLERAMRAPFTLFNDATGFMEARNADGTWAGEDSGWTEGLFALQPILSILRC